MKIVVQSLIVLVMSLVILQGCGAQDSRASSEQTEVKDSTPTFYILNKNEDANISIDLLLQAQTEDTKVQIIRNIESNKMYVNVLEGSVEVSVDTSNN